MENPSFDNAVNEAFRAAVHEAFRAALQANGIIPPDQVVDDGQIHRCDVQGHPGRSDASYLLHFDGGCPAGGFQDWTSGEGWQNWCFGLERELTADEIDDLRRKIEADDVQRKEEEISRRADAARRAGALWSVAALCTEHPYLTRKGVQPHGLRISHGDLVVPLRDTLGLLHSLQFITATGEKKYIYGGRVSGCYFTIGDTFSNIIPIGEGFATCATVHEATKFTTAAALSCTNLLAVATALRGMYPTAKIVILSDDDFQTAGNPGLTKAREAAAAVGGVVAVPDFGPDRPDGATDFNDLARHAGFEAVRKCVEAALSTDTTGRTASYGSAKPDMDVLQMHRRSPPAFPIEVLGPAWASWVANAANAAAAPVDYVIAPLLPAASVLIGNARWASATPGWSEPPHLWGGAVGDSGAGKSPGADPLMRIVLPAIERRMLGDFPDQLELWRTQYEITDVLKKEWKKAVGQAHKRGGPPPDPPPQAEPEPQPPKLRQNDVTVERVATLLATSAPKGLLINRDELAGWIAGMNQYNDAGRAFWLETFGGRPYRVERQKAPPIDIHFLVVGVYGSVQPDRLAALMHTAIDDGLLSRLLWFWPEPVPFRLGTQAPDTEWAIDAFDRLRLLEMTGNPPRPLEVPLAESALPVLEEFANELQRRQREAGGLMRSALGKGRGLALRLSLVLEFLWWSAIAGADAPPTEISLKAFAAAAALLDRYFLPMAERVYGDAALPDSDRHAATIARWIVRERPTVLNARDLRRKVRLPGLSKADDVKSAIGVLVEAAWLSPTPSRGGSTPGRQREDYIVNPRVIEELPNA